jgi:hypothetical protein
MLTNCLTDTLTDAVPCLLILSGLSQHPYCTLSDPYLPAYRSPLDDSCPNGLYLYIVV